MGVLTMFVLAGAVAGGFFYSSKQKFDPAPTSAAWGKPGRAVRVMAIDLHDGSTELDQNVAADADVDICPRNFGTRCRCDGGQAGYAAVAKGRGLLSRTKSRPRRGGFVLMDSINEISFVCHGIKIQVDNSGAIICQFGKCFALVHYGLFKPLVH